MIVKGANSIGIFAQSVGGGGGSGGFNGILATNATIDNAVGGAGGAGGNGGDVTVTSSGSILTLGANSTAILAQSIGGGGGNGAFSLEAGDNSAFGAGLFVGGSLSGGGGDGTKGTVTVIVSGNGSTATMAGLSYGLLGQSIGGGGGNGGLVVPDPLTVGAGGITVRAGGTGSVSGNATAQVSSNSNAVFTQGAGSIGLISQSIGGGGGVNGLTGDVNVSTASLLSTIVGGTSSGGGRGDAATLTITGTIATGGDNATGALAQSIGGGGGVANTSLGKLLDSQGLAVGTAKAIVMTIGGSSGGIASPESALGPIANTGAAATVSSTRSTSTTGALASGLIAQSIGGGGGLAGFAAPEGIQTVDGLTITVGGVASMTRTPSSGGNAGSASVIAAGVSVTGAGSNGIVTQSIGAGGGLAGVYSGAGYNPGPAAAILGGNSASGSGSSASSASNGAITVTGAGAVGILTQSIGGGGGAIQIAGAGASGASLVLGASNGAGGNGRTVTVLNDGSISTATAGAHGIVAQSIGGGGGFMTAADQSGGLLPVSISKGIGGLGGNGGAVSVNSTRAIMTTGPGASGIIAQSVGGGGGVVGGGVFSSTMSSGAPFAGSAGGAGNAAAVTVTNSDWILSSGAGAFGIFAQSAAGSGSGSGITVTAAAHVFANGAGSTAILGESSGSGGTGNIEFTINKGVTVSGGSGGGAGASFIGGAVNSLKNEGVLTSVSAIDGYAARGTAGDDHIENRYLMIGSIDLERGANSVLNGVNAIYMPGITASVGAGNTLTNLGLISPGDFQRLLTTNLTGNLVQTALGAYGVDYDLKLVAADQIVVSGTASVSGIVAVNLISPNLTASAAKPGTFDNVIVAAAGGETHQGIVLEAPNTAVSNYSLIYATGNDITLRNVIDYSPAGLSGNQASVGDAVNRIQGAQISPAFAPIATALFFQPSIASLARAYDLLSGSATAATQQTAFGSSDAFFASASRQMAFWMAGDGGPVGTTATAEVVNTAVQSYAALGGPVGDVAEARTAVLAVPELRHWRFWATGSGGSGNVTGNLVNGTAGARTQGAGLDAGVDFEISRNALAGVAIGSGLYGFNAPSRLTSGSVEAGHVSAYAAVRDGSIYGTAVLGASAFYSNTRRYAGIPGVLLGLPGGDVAVPGLSDTLKGQFMSYAVSGQLEAGYRISAGWFDLTPFAGLQFSALRSDSYAESGSNAGLAAPLGLAFSGRTNSSLPSFLGLELKSVIDLGSERQLSVRARAAWKHEFLVDRSIEAAFQAAPGFTFVARGATPASDAVRTGLDLKLTLDDSVAIYSSFEGEFSSVGQSYSGSAGLRINW